MALTKITGNGSQKLGLPFRLLTAFCLPLFVCFSSSAIFVCVERLFRVFDWPRFLCLRLARGDSILFYYFASYLFCGRALVHRHRTGESGEGRRDRESVSQSVGLEERVGETLQVVSVGQPVFVPFGFLFSSFGDAASAAIPVSPGARESGVFRVSLTDWQVEGQCVHSLPRSLPLAAPPCCDGGGAAVAPRWLSHTSARVPAWFRLASLLVIEIRFD